MNERDERAFVSTGTTEARLEALRELADLVPGILWGSDAGGHRTWVSPKWEQYTGQPGTDALGFGWLPAVHADDRETIRQAYAQAHASQEGVRLEYRLRGADGAFRWVVNVIEPRRSAEGEFLGFVGSTIDVTDRIRVAEALAQHAAMLDHVFDPIFVWRLGGPIVYWNKGAERVYGYLKEEAVGRISHDLLQTTFPDALSVKDLEEMLGRDGMWAGELVHLTKSGQCVTVDATLKVATLSSTALPGLEAGADWHTVVLEANRDVTDQRRAEAEAVRRAGQQDCVAALGRLAAERDDPERLMNQAVRQVAAELAVEHVQILRFDSKDRIFTVSAGAGWLSESLVGDELASALEPQAAFTLASGEPVIVPDLVMERRFSIPRRLRQAGAASALSVLIRDHPHPYGVLAVYSKTCRRFAKDEVVLLRAVANVLATAIQQSRANRALRDREARMVAVIDTALEGIISIDEKGTIESVNPAACRLFAYEPAELIGRNVNMLMPEPYHTEHDGYMMSYIRTGKARIIGIGRDVSGRRKDGSVFPLHLGVSEFHVGGKRMFTGQVRDMTERHRLEREVLEIGSQEQLRIGQDLHDGLCQELTGISFALEVLGQKLAGREAPETASIRKVAELIDQTISHARTLAHGLQPVTLEATGLESALKELAAKTERLFHVSCLFMSEGSVLVHDNVIATHVYRIAQEAIGNAIKHGKARTIMLDLALYAGQLCLTVSDDGMGVDKTAGDGKGIGLRTMTYRARIVGGTLDVRPGERGGTVVICTIPLRQVGLAETNSERVLHDGIKIETAKSTGPKDGGRSVEPADTDQPRGEKAQGLPRRRSPDRPRAARRTDRPGS